MTAFLSLSAAGLLLGLVLAQLAARGRRIRLAEELKRAEADMERLRAEIEALRAEVAEAREFRDKLAKAIGNDQLRRFIEKHGEPVPLITRMQAAEARAERLAEALRDARRALAFAAQHLPECNEPYERANAALAQEDRNV